MYDMYDVDRNGVQQHLYEAPTCDFKKVVIVFRSS